MTLMLTASVYRAGTTVLSAVCLTFSSPRGATSEHLSCLSAPLRPIVPATLPYSQFAGGILRPRFSYPELQSPAQG